MVHPNYSCAVLHDNVPICRISLLTNFNDIVKWLNTSKEELNSHFILIVQISRTDMICGMFFIYLL